MKYQNLILEREDGIATLTLNRPDVLNALSMALREDIAKAVDEVRNDDEVRVLIVTGAGRGFCSGADVGAAERAARRAAEKTRSSILHITGIEIASPWLEVEKPTIAAVNGVCAGAGLSLALLCDIRIAAESARFSAVWVRRAIIADAGATYLLPRVLGVAKALELMYTGDIIDAREAERIGLVSRVVPDDDLMRVTRELATKIAKGPSVSIELMKRAVYRDIASALATKLDFETYAQHVCGQTEDSREAAAAFVEKREAHFKGR